MVTERELTFQDYLSIARRRWVMVVLPVIIGSGLGYGLTRVLPKRYSSQTLVLVEQPTVPGDYVKPVVTEGTNQRLAAMQQEILSRSRLEPLIQQFGLYREDVIRLPMESLVDRLRNAIKVTPIEPMTGTNAQGLPGFSISVNFDDPRIAQQICSTVTSMFMEQNLRLRQDISEQTTQFLAKQLGDAKAQLDDQDAKLAAFERQHIGSRPEDEQRNLNLVTSLSSQLEAANQALSRAQQDKSFADSMLQQQLAAWQAARDGQSPDTLDKQLAALEAQLTDLKSKYTDDHPDVMKTKNDIAALKKKMADLGDQQAGTGTPKPAKTPAEPSQIQSLRAQIHLDEEAIQEATAQQQEIQKQIRTYQERVQSSPAIEQEYKQLTRDYQTALEMYNDLLKKRDQSAMATDLERRQQGEQFQVLDPANLPDQPSFPKVPLFVSGGAAGGLALGLALTVFFEVQDTSLRSERDVEFLLHLPVLATVPEIVGIRERKGRKLSVRQALRS